MKGLLGWVKTHIVIVVSVAVMIVSLPALLFVSSGMNKKLIDDVTSEVSNDERSLQSITVTYSIPTIDPSNPPVDFTRTPNPATTEAVRAAIQDLHAASSQVVDLAVERNKEGKTLLMEGIFPAPTGNERRTRLEMSRLWVPAHRRLIERFNMGAPLSPSAVSSQIETQYEQRKSRELAAREDKRLTPEEDARIIEQMAELRLSTYHDRAASLTAYADESVFRNVVAPVETDLPSIEQLWDFQHRYWIHEDILRLVKIANTDPRSGWDFTVPEATVKRIESINVAPWDLNPDNPGQPTGDSPDRPVMTNFETSVTGRGGWPATPNAFYDIRYADVKLLVASNRIPRLLDAVNEVNWMSVVSFSMESIDATSDLQSGYYYGDDHLVLVHMRLETIWIRKWMAAFMPDSVKIALGFPVAMQGDDMGDNVGEFDEFGGQQQ